MTILRFLLRRWRADDGPGRPDVSAGLGLLLAFFTLSLTESVTAVAGDRGGVDVLRRGEDENLGAAHDSEHPDVRRSHVAEGIGIL